MSVFKKPGLYFGIISTLIVGFLVFQLVKLNVLPTTYLLAAIGLLVILVALVYVLGFKNNLATKIISGILAVVLCVTSGFGSYYLMRTSDTLDQITADSNKEKHTISLYALKTSPIESVSDIDGRTVGILSTNARTYVDKAIKKIQKETSDVSFTTSEYTSTVQLVSDFKGQKIDLILIDNSNIDVIEDMENQNEFSKEIKEIYTYTYYVKKTKTADSTDVSTQPFSVLISGSDSRGGIDEVSRSDVDMVVTVNPSTHTILMTSIPRDYYVDTVCEESMGCANGQKDKLTHTGLHGVETTEMTIENLLGMEINYNVKVGFETVTQLVNTLGGITVNNPQEFSTGTYTFSIGNIELNGDEALAFARERYSFTSGDRERGRNQMRVLTGIIKKMISPSILTNYSSIMDSLSSTFHTNMSMDEISALVRNQLSSGSSWSIYTNSLDGTGGTDYCYELGDNASIIYPDENSISVAKTNIEAVLMGEEPPYATAQS